MSSEHRSEINRANAQHSTGPRSAEGKARTRLNAVRHGLRSKSVLMPGENPEEYYELKTKMLAEWKPQGTTEEFQVEQMLQNQWRLRRIALMEQDLFVEAFEGSFGEEEFDANAPGALTAALADHKLALLTRYENSTRRAYYKALNELRSLQSERRKATQAEQKAAHEAHVRQVVGEMEAANEKMNMDLIAMCERVPAVPNDGYKYIVPSPLASFGAPPADASKS
jgi:hypothetical protein